MSSIDGILQKQSPVFEDSEMADRGMLGFRSRKPNFSSVKPVGNNGVVGFRKRENDTPADVYLASLEEAPAQLPKKYALLESLYDDLEAAISFLDIRRQLCSFQAVCSTIEANTKRCFLQRRLAQIKHILPEAIDLEYVHPHEQNSHNKKYEMKISLLPLPAEAEVLPSTLGCSTKKPKIEAVQRRRVFRVRLSKFASIHSEEDDVPEHPLPQLIFSENSASKGAYSVMPAVTTCIAMRINTAPHRVKLSDSEILLASSMHFSKPFKPSFSIKSVKPAGSFISNERLAEVSSACSRLSSNVLPMPINRTTHRDVHNGAELPLGTSHFTPSFRPFFSISRSLSETVSASEDCANVALATDAPSSSVELEPVKCHHVLPEEELEIVQPEELQTPIKPVQTFRTPQRSSTAVYKSAKKRPHFSIVNQSSYASNSLFSTPAKPSMREEVSVEWDLRAPARTSNAVDQCSLIEGECDGLKTPVKSSRTSMKSSKYCYTPGTPLKSERGDGSVYVSYHADQEEFQSPDAAPMKHASSVRSLKFNSPEDDSKISAVTGSLKAALFTSPCPSEPYMDVPSTPVIPSRALKFGRKVAIKHTKLNLGPLFGSGL